MISKDTAPHYLWGGNCDGWHLVRNEALSVIQERVPPGGAEVRHFHEHARQFFFVLRGSATLEVGGTVHVLTTQQGVEIEPGVAHRLSNDSIEELEFLVVSQPPSHGDRVLAPL